MLRTAVRTALRRPVASTTSSSVRLQTTAAQKRALNKQQLAGQKEGAGAAPKPDPPAAAPPSDGGSGGGGGMVVMGALLLAGAGGGYMYTNELGPFAPETESAKASPSPSPAATKETPAEKPADPVVEEAEKEESAAPVEEKKVEEVAVVEKEEAPAVEVSRGVTTISLPPPGTRPASEPVPEVLHPAAGHRVSMAPGKPVPSEKIESSVEQAARELRSSEDEAADETLKKAHQALRANLDESLLKDLDTLSATELKIRVVQLAAEMKERTKWEAVRLKEFLSMKEKETSDKYMELLQKQRIEFESLLARRMLEQEDALSRQATAALQQKENAIQSVVNAAAEAQQAEHEADLKSMEERLGREINAKYETEYSTKLANEKAEYVQELQGKVSQMEEMSQKLQKLESALKESNTFKSGSLRAHRVSAAALALAKKMESSKGAAEELAALRAAAGGESVIGAAVKVLPDAVKTGVPTLSELQAKFDTVYKKSRQASLVPEGWSGLEGQLMGMAFSTLKLSPSPDDPVPEEDKAGADYVLARAQRHVQLGELDRAVELLDKLKGQAAFTASDWKKDASDRIAVEKALKVINLECSLLNQSMGSGSGDE
mmetsp:Transcript_3857/g.5898  ORF Transcript_3857/g.5898 Transcript_3857/m.5898 type:complete len:605 (+) Transcript_3857:162-1976(+)|eukprot:CAMPEP_0195292916 /NCGR_PEP_ID=MMETSP0707-20130614/11210_1 /TAXON_ID=33640 /ORGANISM="Asterionellopsis glacialis, Strain CCMP134" /LENGTH=604 /DNA_ID=CAMNT_0040353511 /DNA_START=52 /DNA_END=1869 /DNA_ORIENTATION=-